MNNESRQCSACNAALPPDAPGGHCAACLLQLGLAAEWTAPPVAEVPPLKPGDRIGPYELLEQIGEGGCGVVFMAAQSEPVRRRVALKVIKLGMDTQQVIARFQAEWQALALLDHPNIARIFDAGATASGRPYFVMELVRGVKITDYCDRHQLSTRRRLELFTQVCRALQHAHQKGIIHRDLKPSNILVTEGEGDAGGSPRIIDFGIAKSTAQPLTDQTLFTAFHQFMGTPAYMSPEQAAVGRLDIDTRSDIYSLGALLYELLTGLAPFDAAELRRCALDEILRLVREKEPARPSTRLTRLDPQKLSALSQCRQSLPARLPRLLRGDLDFVVMKCLEKDRARRYESASALAVDLERHLRNEPVTARPPGTWYRFRKLARRNRVAFAFAASIVLAVALGIFASAREGQRARLAEREQGRWRGTARASESLAKTQATKSAQVAQYLANILQSATPAVALGRDTTVVRRILDSAAKRIDSDLAGQPEVQAELLCTLAQAYHELGLHRQMADAAREAVRLSRPYPAVENLLAAKALANLGEALTQLGELKEAETVSRQALAMREKLLGDEHPDVSVSLNNLGLVLRDRGQWAEAEALFRKSLALDRKLLGNDHPKIAAGLGNLGAVLWDEGRFDEAEAAFREGLALRRRLYGNQHPDIAVSLNNLAAVLTSKHRYAEAEVMTREALDLDRQFLGDEHPDIALALNNLGVILEKQFKHTESQAAYRAAASIFEHRVANPGSLLK